MRTPVVVQSRSEIKFSELIMGPCWSSTRALMHHYELSRGLKGVDSKVQVFTVDASVCR